MRLKTLPVTPLKHSSRFTVVLTEAGALPRWQFDYDGKKTYDPRPDALVLGAYIHPSTGNRLVGGINLNYMTNAEVNQLERILPQLTKGRNLYERYNIGRSLSPTLFTTYYRTYNADNINMIGKSRAYPQYGEFVEMPDQRTEFEPAEAPPPQEADDLDELDTVAPAPRTTDTAVPTEPVQPVQVDIDQDQVMRAQEQDVQDEIAQAEPIEEPTPAVQPPEAYEADIEPSEPEEMPDYDVLPEPQPELATREVEPLPTEELPEESEEEDLEPIDDHDVDRIEESRIRYYSPSQRRYITETWTRSRSTTSKHSLLG